MSNRFNEALIGFYEVISCPYTDEVVFADIKHNVSYALMKWVYTDEINIESDSTFLLELLRAATRFKLEHLRQRWHRCFLILQ